MQSKNKKISAFIRILHKHLSTVWKLHFFDFLLYLGLLKLTRHVILYYLWSADLSKSFSWLILLIFIYIFFNSFGQYLSFPDIFAHKVSPGWKLWGFPTWLLISRFIDSKVIIINVKTKRRKRKLYIQCVSK